MTVKEVFDLRKQGKIEEAYEAIRPMYAVHKGKYTTLCMFWVGSDIMKKRLAEKRTDEAAKIFEALLRVAPNIDDKDHKVHEAMLHDAMWLKKERPTFSMLDFIKRYGVDRLTDDDWKALPPTPSPDNNGNTHPLPSTAQRIMTQCFHEIQQHPDIDHALMAIPLLQEAMRRQPNDKHTRRYMAVAYRIAGEYDKAADIYRQLLERHHDSYIYAELAELTKEPGAKAALLCRAIQRQRQEKFCTGYRLSLAKLLAGRDDRRAAYELRKCIAVRKREGYHDTREIHELEQQLKNIEPASESEQKEFYRRMAEKYGV